MASSRAHVPPARPFLMGHQRLNLPPDRASWASLARRVATARKIAPVASLPWNSDDLGLVDYE